MFRADLTPIDMELITRRREWNDCMIGVRFAPGSARRHVEGKRWWRRIGQHVATLDHLPLSFAVYDLLL